MAKKKESMCALIGAPCPKTNKDTDPVYCPDWVENIPEIETDGSGRVSSIFYTGCQRRRQTLYMLSMTASAGQAAASADKAATQVNHVSEVIQLFTSQVVINPFAGLIDLLPEAGDQSLLTEGGVKSVQDMGRQ